MDDQAAALAAQLVGKAYIEQGRQALKRREGLAKALLSQRKLPAEGWDDASIEGFLHELAMMDSNNFLDNAGVGER
jgi:O-phospho-L-seryl-tRNASec:L-selenocysteinyl-tRNA synthase